MKTKICLFSIFGSIMVGLVSCDTTYSRDISEKRNDSSELEAQGPEKPGQSFNLLIQIK